MSALSGDSAVPQHVGIIMDGNRRWAKEHGLPSLRGHAKGQQVLRQIAKHAFRSGVQYLTVYAFSTENWQRSQEEVGYLMKHVALALRKYTQEFVDGGVKIVFLGSRENLPKAVLAAITDTEVKTAGNTAATFAICLNYGGMQEIADATKQIIASGISAAEVTPEVLASYMYSPEIPPIDLVIRTSGEQRLSNFMLWRSAYSEFLFTDTKWPDFTPQEFDTLLAVYAQRSRRFGK